MLICKHQGKIQLVTVLLLCARLNHIGPSRSAGQISHSILPLPAVMGIWNEKLENFEWH